MTAIPPPDPVHFTDYLTPAASLPARPYRFPSFAFYRRITGIVLSASRRARLGRFDDVDWYYSSLRVRDTFEAVGARIRVQGTQHLHALGGKPAVIIGNHMSTAETFLLSTMLLPFGPVTFVVKQALVEYPIFKHIMLSRNPVVVGRVNPREDLKAVLDGGMERLRAGVSVVIFPQKTRSATFDRMSFNTIGIKVAKRAEVPIVPLALKTDAWSNGKRFKDFGRFQPEQPVEFAFGEPFMVEGPDKIAHERVLDFIEANLRQWQQ